MKKLLAAGETRIFDFARVFRNRERGPLHAPEFTMLEWYRAGEPYEAVMADTLARRRRSRRATGKSASRLARADGRSVCAGRALTVAEAFRRHRRHRSPRHARAMSRPRPAGRGSRTGRHPRRRPTTAGPTSSAASWSRRSSRTSASAGRRSSTNTRSIEAALARAKPGDRARRRALRALCLRRRARQRLRRADRPAEQRRRFAAEMDEKARLYGERYPIDEDFLAALAEMPEASGVALGFDRLVMLATGAPRIDQVQWTPVDRRESYDMNDMSDATPPVMATSKPAAELCGPRPSLGSTAGLVIPPEQRTCRDLRAPSPRATPCAHHARHGRADRSADPHDPIARQFVPDPAELDTPAGGTRRPDRRRRPRGRRRAWSTAIPTACS